MRPDGKRVKKMTGEYAVIPHIMVERNDALNYTEVDIPLEPIQKYVNAKRKEGIPISHISVILSAYSRVVGEYPLLNRFVVNRKVYSRNELAVLMVVLKSGSDEGTTSKIKLDPADTIFDTNRKVNEYIEENRKEGDTNSTDKLVSILLRIPGLLNFGVRIFKWMDKHGLLPWAIVNASPFHASMGITNLASIRTDFIYHHPYNFGTTGLFLAIGNSKEIPVRRGDTIEFEKCMPIGCVMDERICSGLYFASAFKKFRKYLANPQLLETPPEKVIKEVPYRADIKKAKEEKKAAKKAAKEKK